MSLLILLSTNAEAFDQSETYVPIGDDGYYHLSNADQVEWFSWMVNTQGHGCMNVKLDADIDFGGIPNAHQPIGRSAKKFGGHFDGQGHTIYGMVITPDIVLVERPYDGVGFFGSIRAGFNDTVWGKSTNDVIIENLIIDSSCSINFDGRWGAGIAGHENARMTDTSKVIIRNCGNQADIICGGNTAAGILGCVDATDIALEISGCYNTGNISGAAESALICGWAGRRNNADVKITYCWNTGKLLNGIDATKNLWRANASIYTSNMYDFNLENMGDQGKTILSTTYTDALISGELCYVANGDQSSIHWYQIIGTENNPIPFSTSMQVYVRGTLKCDGTSAGEVEFTNESSTPEIPPHTDNNINGFCDVCGKLLVTSLTQDLEGIYLISNAGELEKFGDMVNNTDNPISAKLTSDIDLDGITHYPIGRSSSKKFRAIFDGQNYRIKNMKKFSQTENVGLFGWLRGGCTVKNVIIDKSCAVTGLNWVGGIAGTAQVATAGTITIENCGNEGTVECTGTRVGGIFGSASEGNQVYVIKNCWNTGAIKGPEASSVSGIAGWIGADVVEVTFENCWNAGLCTGNIERGNTIANGTVAGNIKTINCFDISSSPTRGGVKLDNATISEGKISFTRELKSGTWSSVCIPVNVSAEVFHDNALVKELSGFTVSGDVYSLELSDASELQAGVTYFVKTSVDVNNIIADVSSVNVSSSSNSKSQGFNTLIATGVYQEQKAPYGSFVLSDNKFYLVDSDVTVSPYRSFISTEGSIAAKSILFDEAITSISIIKSSVENNVIYDLMGRRVNNALKGVFIINGKKVVK